MPKPKKSERESPWFKYGTDKQYQAWCRTQPSAYSGDTRNIVFAHHRTAANAGTGFKPPFSGIPLTYEEHNLQHQIGAWSFMSRDRWDFLCQLHLEKWVNSMMQDCN